MGVFCKKVENCCFLRNFPKNRSILFFALCLYSCKMACNGYHQLVNKFCKFFHQHGHRIYLPLPQLVSCVPGHEEFLTTSVTSSEGNREALVLPHLFLGEMKTSCTFFASAKGQWVDIIVGKQLGFLNEQKGQDLFCFVFPVQTPQTPNVGL